MARGSRMWKAIMKQRFLEGKPYEVPTPRHYFCINKFGQVVLRGSRRQILLPMTQYVRNIKTGLWVERNTPTYYNLNQLGRFGNEPEIITTDGEFENI